MSMNLDEIDNLVSDCSKCGSLVEKFPSGKTFYIGTSNDIVLVGEAPANNGWRKSKMLWRDVNGRMLPSGVVLQKLFDIINRKVLDTTFIEAIKCYPIERSSIPTCFKNCHNILISQLNILRPKLIITLGDAATKSLIGDTYKNFKEVVGMIHEVDGFKVLPIYHPSPVSPMSYKGNIEIFERLRDGFYEDK